MKQIDEMIASINPQIYRRFQTAIELGKWPDGAIVEPQQMELLLQVTIAYGAKNNLNDAQLFKVDSAGEFQDGKEIRQQASMGTERSHPNEIPIHQTDNSAASIEK